jgi:radical SAM superfamily enzyme YgiQ (UPF0313 family)
MTGTQTKFAIECAKMIRQDRHHIPIVWAGAHPTILPEQVIASGFADYVVQREVDETIVQITQDIANHKAQKIIDSPLPDMEKLLPEPYELLDIEKYIHPDIYVKNSPRTMDIGQTSRGCPFQCGFCSSATIRQRKWRAMSAEKATDMIKDNVRRFNLSGFWLRDDEFYISQQRAAKITEGILPLNMRWYTSGTRVDIFNKTPDEQVALYRRSGAHTLKFGAESGNNRILKLMSKGITREETLEANRKAKRNGIVPAFALMCGFPTETFDEINDTISLAKEIRATNPQSQFETMCVYTALPATPMWEFAIQHGLKPPTKLEEWGNWTFDEYDHKGKRIPWFNPQERQALGNLCYISMLSNALPNVIDSLQNKSIKYFMKVAYPIPHKYFQWRFFNAHYKYTGELGLVQYLRKKVFYSGHNIIR